MSKQDGLVSATISLVLFQVVSRLFSFGLNQVLLRSSTPIAVGTAMSLDLIRDTVLFTIREPLRGAFLRRPRTQLSPVQKFQLDQTALLPALASPLLLILFYTLHALLGPALASPQLGPTTALYALSGVLELLSEPAYLALLRNWETKTTTRVRVEAFAVGAKAVANVATVAALGAKAGILGFGVGAVAYAGVLLVGFTYLAGVPRLHVRRPAFKSDEDGVVVSGRFDPQVLSLAKELTGQGLLKQLLTESDKIVVSRISKVEDQGGYAIALNYGSLIARLLFQPLEESARLSFSSSLATPSPASLRSSATLLSSLLLLQTHLSLAFFFLAPYFTSPLLYHLLGPRWSAPRSSAPLILGTYCRYLPFLAVNGLTEAFFQSAADPKWLRRGNLALAASSAAFLLGVAMGVQAGWAERGLVYANCVGMAVRIGFALRFIGEYFSEAALKEKGMKEADRREVRGMVGWRRWVPKLGTVGLVLVGWGVVRWSEGRGEWRSLRGLVEHGGVGAVVGVVCVVVIYAEERDALRSLMAVVRKRKTD